MIIYFYFGTVHAKVELCRVTVSRFFQKRFSHHTHPTSHANYSSRRVILPTGTTYVGYRLGAHECAKSCHAVCYGIGHRALSVSVAH